MNDSKQKRFKRSLIATVTMIFGLSFASYALSISTFESKGNPFYTGSIQINLNDGKPIIETGEVRMEQGMTIIRDFFIKNEGTGNAYYKIYFSELDGDLADVLEVTLKDVDHGKLLYQGLAKNMTKENAETADDILNPGDLRNMTIQFFLPVAAEDTEQGSELSFDLEVMAVQVKNNPEGLFQ